MKRLIFILALLTAFPAYGEGRIHTVSYTGQNFYHFRLRLTPDNTRLVLPGYQSKYAKAPWTFKDGLFEFYVKKGALPLAASNCQKYVIVRSPYIACTENSQSCQARRNERETLFRTIDYTLNNGGGMDVVLETIPGFTAVQGGKPVLTSCNLYLRTYKDRYIAYTGPLKTPLVHE